VRAAEGRPFSDFIDKPSTARLWLSVHAEIGAFDALNAFVSQLATEDRWRCDEYIAFAKAVLKGGKTHAHYAALDPLLGRASSGKHKADKLRMIAIGADLMLRGKTRVPASFFTSTYFVDTEGTDSLVLPTEAGRVRPQRTRT